MIKGILAGLGAVFSLFLSVHVFQSFALGKVLYHGVLCFVLPLMHIASAPGKWKEGWKKIGFKVPFAGKALVWTVCLCVLLWGLVFLAYLLFARDLPERKELWKLIGTLGVSRASLYLIGVYVIVINPFLEELFWRGYVQSFLMNRCSPWLRILVPSIFFGVIHFFPLILVLPPGHSFVISVGIGCVGALWAFSRLKSDSLLPALVSHSLGADLMIVFLAWRILF